MGWERKIIYILPFLIKSLIFWRIDPENFLKKIPFFTSSYSDFDEIEEAIFMLDHNLNPFEKPNMFHKPIIVYFFAFLGKNRKFLSFLFFAILDMLFVHLALSKNLNFREKKLKTEESSKENDKYLFFYFYNPIMFIGSLIRWTGSLNYFLIFLSLYLFSKSKIIAFCVVYAFSIYQNPFNICYLILIFIQNQRKINVCSILFPTLMLILLMLHISSLIIGDWSFLNAYYFSYFPSYYEPNLGLIWALFSGSFNRYKLFYNFCFVIFPLIYLYPLYQLFRKYHENFGQADLKEEQQSNMNISFCVGIIQTVNIVILSKNYLNLKKLYVLFFQYTTICDIFLVIFLLYLNTEIIYKVKILIILNFGLAFFMFLTCGLTIHWFYSISGNPNFLFFQSVAFYAFFVVFVTEYVNQLKKRNDLKSIENYSKNLIAKIVEKI